MPYIKLSTLYIIKFNMAQPYVTFNSEHFTFHVKSCPGKILSARGTSCTSTLAMYLYFCMGNIVNLFKGNILNVCTCNMVNF